MPEGANVELAHKRAAVGRRFKAHGARLAVNVLAALVLIYTLASVVDLPRV